MKNNQIPLSADLLKFMHRVGIEQANGWHGVEIPSQGAYACPESIDAQCGYCGIHGALIAGKEISSNRETRTLTFKARCTRDRCKEDSTVVMVGAATWGDYQQNSARPKEFWILPKPEFREPSVKDENIGNKRIVKAYKEAIESYNGNRPSLAISACGRIVEAIGKTKFPNASNVNNIKPLYNHLRKEVKEIPHFKELLEPFFDLGEALRLGRNPGSHFDLETDPDLGLAGKVIDLTEFLLKYIYVIPREAEEVQKLIDESGPGKEDEDKDLDLGSSEVL